MERREYINEKYNCDLQFVTIYDWHSHMFIVNTSLVACDKLANVFRASFDELWQNLSAEK